jgi:hypothetical protein
MWLECYFDNMNFFLIKNMIYVFFINLIIKKWKYGTILMFSIVVNNDLTKVLFCHVEIFQTMAHCIVL